MSRLAQRAEAGPWESIWVYDHFHTTPDADRTEPTHEAWTLMAAFAASDQPGPARPDVHLHRLPQPGLPGQGRRDGRRHLRRPGRDGHRRRLVRARMAGLRLRLPARAGSGSARSTRACRSCSRPGRPARRRCRARSIRSTARIVRPLPLQPGGIPFWIAGGGEKVTLRIAAQYAQYTNFDGTPEAFRHKSEVLAGHCQRLGRDFDAITRSANYNIAIGRDEKEVADRLARIRDHYTEAGGRRAGRQAAGRLRRHARGRHAGADRREAVGAARRTA